MKYSCKELIDNLSTDRKIDGVIDFSSKIDNVNILNVEETDVYGSYSYDKYSEKFTFYLTVYTKVTVPSSISLKPIEIIVDFDTDLYYTFKVVDDDSFLIKGNEIKLDDEIWGEILLQLPLRATLEGEEFVEEENEEVLNNPFSSL